MDRKFIMKMIAGMLAFILTFANVSILGAYANESIASSINLEGQSTKVDNASIEFDAYFDVDGVKKHSKEIDMKTNSDKIFLSIKVTDGYLKSGTIRLINPNFVFVKDDTELNYVQNIDEETNTVTLNQINKGDTVILELPIKMKNDDSFEITSIETPSGTTSVLFAGTYVDNKGQSKDISNEIEVQAIMTAEAEAYLDARVTKYVPFNIDESKGVIIQQVIRSCIKYNVMPVRNTTLEIEIPKINNIEPRVAISTNGTKATNGGEEKTLKLNEDYYYNANGNIFIPINNDRNSEDNGNVSWLKNCYDEIIVNYVYEGEIPEEVELATNIESKIRLYDNKNTLVSGQIEKTETLNTKVEDIVTFSAKTDVDTLSKGYMLVSGADNTTYTEKWLVNIGNKNIVGNIILKGNEVFLDENANRREANVVYTKTKIDEENFKSILGEEGYIDIYNQNDEKIVTLNKNKLEYTYTEETTYIKIETNKPEAEGILIIENERGIKAGQSDKTSMLSFDRLAVGYEGRTMIGTRQAFISEAMKSIRLENPKTQASIVLSRNDFSTVVTNEDVEVKVTLKTKDSDTVLYKNPVIEMEFPQYVTELTITETNILYGNSELQIKKYEVITNNNGNKVIRIELDGEQTRFYKDATADGDTIVMKADITANEYTPSRQESIKASILNNTNSEEIEVTVPMNFVAPTGLITINQMSNFDDNGTVITSLSNKQEVGEIQKNSSSKTATINMTVINNYNYNCESIILLGRIPFASNKEIVSNKDMGSTFTTKMVKGLEIKEGITSDKITIYYSSNGDATNDLNNEQNGWTENIANLEDAKSYMIVTRDFSLIGGEALSFAYDVMIPEGLDYNQSTYGTNAVYFKAEGAELIQVVEGAKIGITTGQGPNLTTTLTANVNSDEKVEENQIITYTAKITNNINRKQEGVSLVLQVPSNVRFVSSNEKYETDELLNKVTISVGSIEANSEKTVEFKLKVNKTSNSMTMHYYDENGNEITEEEAFKSYETPLTLADFDGDEEKYNNYLEYLDKYQEYKQNKEQQANSDDKKVVVKVKAIVDGYDDAFESNEIQNTIGKQSTTYTEPKLGVEISSNNKLSLQTGDVVKYYISLNPTDANELTEVTVTCELPEELEYISSSENGEYNKTTRIVTWKFDKLENFKSLEVECKAKALSENVYEKDIQIKTKATCKESSKVFEDMFSTKVVDKGFSLSQTSNISDGYLSSGDEITYTITVKNLGTTKVAATISDILPEELSFVKLTYSQNGMTTVKDDNNSNKVEIPISLDASETLTIYLTAKARELNETREISNKVILSSAGIVNLESNVLTHRINTNKNTEHNESSNSSEEEAPKYRISGVVWEDTNKNGQREDTESFKQGINVILLDSDNNIVSRAVTDQNGLYNFTDVEKGKYVVAFEYDNLEYDLTTYQAKDVNASVNSDVIDMMLNINGKVANYAATNAIQVSANTYNVDAGLVVSPKFDLELTKSVSLMQVSNAKGTENYTFDKVKTGKVEIPSKDIEGSVVAITYTFTIENKGAVSGYAKKIVDYIPKDLSFSSNLNPDWYLDTDGNLYNISLANRVINPDEKVEIDLILTKTMTDENTGNVMNSAEIFETSNDQGIKDIDSTAGNRATNEDDYDTADAIITIKTGGPVLYTGIALIVLVIFAIGSYIIKKKVLMKI